MSAQAFQQHAMRGCIAVLAGKHQCLQLFFTGCHACLIVSSYPWPVWLQFGPCKYTIPGVVPPVTFASNLRLRPNFSHDFNLMKIVMGRVRDSYSVFSEMRALFSPFPTHSRGVSRPSRTLRWECGGRGHIAGRAMRTRTSVCAAAEGPPVRK